jgi:uncharacterized membrane protein YgcG
MEPLTLLLAALVVTGPIAYAFCQQAKQRTAARLAREAAERRERETRAEMRTAIKTIAPAARTAGLTLEQMQQTLVTLSQRPTKPPPSAAEVYERKRLERVAARYGLTAPLEAPTVTHGSHHTSTVSYDDPAPSSPADPYQPPTYDPSPSYSPSNDSSASSGWSSSSDSGSTSSYDSGSSSSYDSGSSSDSGSSADGDW